MKKRAYRFRWVLVVSGLALAHAACGGDDKAGGDGPDGSASGGTSGSSHGDGGNVGGRGDGGSGGGASGSGGGSSGAGGGASGAGGMAGGGNLDGGPSSSCTPRDEVPAPIRTGVTAAPACTGEAACGGDLDGTSWAYLDVCVDQDVAFAEVFDECPESILTGVGDQAVSGTLSFEGGVATHQASIAGTGVFHIPAECVACNCTDFAEVTLYNRGVSAFCYEDCYPPTHQYPNSCRCLVDFEYTVDDSEPYEVSGNSITLESGRTYDYCSAADRLTLSESGASPLVPGSAELVPPTALDTPEICDGIDSDHDGVVDDDPVDCPIDCNTEGVCAEVERVCAGAAGWRCDYTSTAYEEGDETRCDGLDNDCDGEVDEGLVGCEEICDGLDNDNNGTVDDNLTDAIDACPTTRGVCTSGVTPTCEGASGWRCDYSSAAHRAVETLCDALDNDCDGMVDEGCACSTGQSKMFVLRMGATNAGIVRANLDGSNPELIVPIPQFFVFDLAIDPKNEKIYYYDFGSEEIKRANLDGTAVTPVWSGKTQMFAIDPGTPQRGFAENDTYTIRSFLFSTPATTPTIVTPASVVAFAVDPIRQHIYWSDHGGQWPNGIMRASYDGSDPTGVFGSPVYVQPAALAVDPENGWVYYGGSGGVRRVELDGENDALVIPDIAPSELALDLAGGKVYLTDERGDAVHRAALDGTNLETGLLGGSDAEGARSIALYICAP